MPSASQQRIGAVRRFNRFYTRQIGVLRKNYLDSPYSLGEMRGNMSLERIPDPAAYERANFRVALR